MGKDQKERAERLEKRNDAIVKKFLEISSVKYNGKVQLFSDNAILAMLSDEFYLSKATIDDIVNGRTRYNSGR